MDWDEAIERNRVALKHILAWLAAVAGFAPGGEPGTLPRHLHRAVLMLLRPAEAAVRRLVIAAARGLAVQFPPARPRRPEQKAGFPRSRSTGMGAPARPRHLSLPLVDPLPPWNRYRRPTPAGMPRISVPGFGRPFPVEARRSPLPGDPVDAARLALRLAALGRVLDDLPAQAKRFARWQARVRAAAGAQNNNLAVAGARNNERQAGRTRRIWPLRPGRPPGGRGRSNHEVHQILENTHGLALWALESPDTS